MEIMLRKGQTVYAADGKYLGDVLQCDSRVMVIGQSRWTSDHLVLPVEEVAASGTDVVFLRAFADAIPAETAEPWWPSPDPSGNANGVDIEPLRWGMAEIEDRSAGIGASPGIEALDARRGASSREPPLPSAEDAMRLERERIARIDAEIDRRIGDELADFEIGAGLAAPAPCETAKPSHEAVREPRASAPAAPSDEGRRGGELAGASWTPTPAAARAARSERALERILRRAGFSRLEAKAITAGGFDALVSFTRRSRGIARVKAPRAGERGSSAWR